MNNLEKNIKNNRHLFDEHKADKSKMWAEITAKLPNKETKVVRLWQRPLLKVAASIILLLGVFTALQFLTNNSIYSQENSFANKELQEIDMHYKNLVSAQVSLVKNHKSLSLKEKEEFLSFMDELDEEYKILKLEMNKNLDSELILEAIVSNYKKRIELIENLLQRINSSKKTNNTTDGYIL